MREPFLRGIRHTETPFSAGSDHYILSDPTVGIPSPMLIHWPDRFYHTSEDTPDKVSPDSLARSGALAAIYAYWLASAGHEAEWLAHLMVSRFANWASHAAAEVVEAVRGARGGGERAAAWNRYQKLNGFRAERMAAALAELVRLDPGAASRGAVWRERVLQRAATESLWATTTLRARAFGRDVAADAVAAWRRRGGQPGPLPHGSGAHRRGACACRPTTPS